MICRRCGKDAVFWTDTCDEIGRKSFFFLCADCQKKFAEMYREFLGVKG